MKKWVVMAKRADFQKIAAHFHIEIKADFPSIRTLYSSLCSKLRGFPLLMVILGTVIKSLCSNAKAGNEHVGCGYRLALALP